jgi:hypothetical protein
MNDDEERTSAARLGLRRRTLQPRSPRALSSSSGLPAAA